MDRSAYEAEIARLDSDPDDALRGKIVPVTIASDRRSLFSVRLGSDELAEIAAVAEARNQTISEFIRNSALAVARQDSMSLPAPVLEAVDELVKRYQAAQNAQRPRRPKTRKSA